MAKPGNRDAEEKEDSDEVNSAVYKVNLHCPQCAREIRNRLKRRKGVQKVDGDIESGEITVTGKFDSKEIQTIIEKISKKKVEMVSVEAFKEEKIEEEAEVTKTVLKVQMHCDKCEYDIRRRIRKFKGVESVTIDREAQTCMVEGNLDSDGLTQYIRKKIHKHVEIEVQEEEEEDDEEEVPKKEENDKNRGPESKEDEPEKVGEEKKEESKAKEIVAPYFVHCTHAPQLFSDENPNACLVM